nr:MULTISPECIES: MFS transporter [Mycobacteriaceae]
MPDDRDAQISYLPRALWPLRNRDYRLLTLGLSTTLLGNGLWSVALVWQVIAMGGGAGQAAIVMTMFSAGLLISVLPAGVAADRLPKLVVMRASLWVQATLLIIVGVLAVGDQVQIWHLAVTGFAFGIAEGFYIPAYTALLPTILAPEELLAANGIEGVLRPGLQFALGPAIGALLVQLWSPAWAILIQGAMFVLAAIILGFIRPPSAVASETADHEPESALGDLLAGLRYMYRTRWFFATLLFAVGNVLVVVGPIEVLLPFVIRDNGGTPGHHATVLAVFGVAGAVGALLVASRPLPRRYITVMLVLWGLGALPLALIGYTEAIWIIAAVMVVVGATSEAGQVIWGTLLQRRVPAEMLGRASSLDFFVSLVMMPASLALAVPAAHLIGTTGVFIVAGVAPVVFAVIAHLAARLGRDELDHPLDDRT